MKWKQPPIIKIYEALGAVADRRVGVTDNGGQVYSSSGNKFYTVTYDSVAQAIMTNDNGSYWQGYLGYPAIAYLLQLGILDYEPMQGELLRGIPWKDINQKFKNNFDKTLAYILEPLSQSDREYLAAYVAKISEDIKRMDLALLGTKTKPPEGY